MNLDGYLESIVNKIYKILPLKEEGDVGLYKYIKSIYIELKGATNTFEILGSSNSYISIVNTLAYLGDNEFDVDLCKREVFKCLDLLKKVRGDIGV